MIIIEDFWVIFNIVIHSFLSSQRVQWINNMFLSHNTEANIMLRKLTLFSTNDEKPEIHQMNVIFKSAFSSCIYCCMQVASVVLSLNSN